MNQDVGKDSKASTFDVATAIEVCRQHASTRKQAILLATKTQKWHLLVQIQIENERQWREALEIIKKNIVNVQEKIEILQIYGPKLLKEAEKQKLRDQNNYYTASNIKKSGES